MPRKKLVLVYPPLGMSGALVRHLPLSLLYVASDALRAEFDCAVVDTRLSPENWQMEIAEQISPDTLLVGFSVMTGSPVGHALRMSRWVKGVFPHVSVVWGGPHVTFAGLRVLDELSIDYAISGYGALPLARLARHLRGDADALPLSAIPGVIYRAAVTSDPIFVPAACRHELIDYRTIPYHLVEENLHRYGQLDRVERIFPIYSTMGCPYHCAFCSSPAHYRGYVNKYVLLPPREVADHIEYLRERFQATYIYFIDDDSFVDPDHAEAIIDEIDRRGIRVGLGFRGARVNEIARMDDRYLDKLAAAGTTILHIGAESGSQRMLDLMRKNCAVDDIVRINRKLARHPKITAAYNWLVGLPGETLEDLRATRELVMQLVRENPSAIVFAPNRYRPLPGTELYEVAQRHGYHPPATPEEWSSVEVEGDFRPPWYSDEMARMIEMMQVTSYFIDGKLFKLETGDTAMYRVLRLIGRLYGPLARLRFRHGWTRFLLEYRVFTWVARRFRNRDERMASCAE